MLIKTFALKVAVKEGLKKQVDIAQIYEILRVINSLLKGELYKAIRRM